MSARCRSSQVSVMMITPSDIRPFTSLPQCAWFRDRERSDSAQSRQALPQIRAAIIPLYMGIRDFIRYLKEHQDRLERGSELSAAECEATLREAETMVGMADAAVKELESAIRNRRVNLPEEHAIRFAQDVFLYLRDEEEKVKERIRARLS